MPECWLSRLVVPNHPNHHVLSTYKCHHEYV